MSATITFDELNRKTTKTMEYADELNGPKRRKPLTATFAIWYLPRLLATLISMFRYEYIQQLSQDEMRIAAGHLQQLHALLREVLPKLERAGHLPLLGDSVSRLRCHTEDLGDVIENLIIASDQDFQNLLQESFLEVSGK